MGGKTPERVKIWEEHRAESYQGAVTPWDFNQIVGWVRLYAWPGNIRAYLFLERTHDQNIAPKKSFVTRRGNFIEIYVFPEQSNEEILANLKKNILAQAAANSRLRRLYVDTGVLDTLGPLINGIGLTKSPSSGPASRAPRFGVEKRPLSAIRDGPLGLR